MGVNRCRAGTVPVDGRCTPVRLAAIVLLVVSFFGVASVAQPMVAWAVTGEAQQLLNLINQERAAVGAQPLTLRDDLVQIAAQHSTWMASTGTFQHRSDLSAGITGPWTRIGENIAYGWSVSNIHQMFMESEGHCKNNLYSGFNRVGIEFATGGNGAMYVTVVFVQESGGSLPATTLCPYDFSAPTTTTTAAPPTTTTTAPPASTTTTTAAPPATSTTTTAAPPTTTTTAPPATSTTTTAAPPTTTTTTTAAEIVLPLSSTTTTTESTPAPGGFDARATESLVSAADEPVGRATGPTNDHDEPGTFPVAPVAGVAAVLGTAAAWWLVGAKREAARPAASSPWAIPHGGVRPPQ